MIITRNDKEEISSLERHLVTEFEMKNRGGLKYFFGIEVVRSSQDLFLSQRKYIVDLLVETKAANTLIAHNQRLGEFLNQIPTNKERYQRLARKLIYLSHTRLNIAYVVSLVSQLMHNPNKDHMNAVI